MNSNLRIVFLILILSVFFYSKSEAKSLPGYIITENNDTIQGYVKVYLFNRRTGGFVFSGINLEWNYIEVSFKENNQDKYVTYTPKQIKEYGFTFNTIQYSFFSINIPFKSLIKKEKNKQHFTLLVYKDKDKTIFKHQKYLPVQYWYYKNELEPIYHYYVRYNDGSIHKISKFMDLNYAHICHITNL